MSKISFKPFSRSPRFGGVLKFCTLLLFWTFSLVEILSAGSENSFICLTNVAQIRELSPEAAGKGLPVRIVGVVTYYDACLFNLFIQDTTTGIFVDVPRNINTNIIAGQEIEVKGVSGKGEYAPVVEASTIRILGKGKLPVPRQVSINQLLTGLDDGQWVQVTGVVRSTIVLDGRRYLIFDINGQPIMTYVENLDQFDALKLTHATIRLRGVCYSRFNMKRQLRIPWLAVSSLADIVIEKPPPNQISQVSISNLAQFNSVGYYGNLVRVSGVVTLLKSNGSLFIQNQCYGLQVQLTQPAKLLVGDHVMVTGYSALGQYIPILEDATVQFLGHGKSPSPILTDLQNLLNAPENFDAMLVRVKANLINRVRNEGGETLVLESSNSVFTAPLWNTEIDEHSKALKLGCEITLTGVFIAKSPDKWIPGVAQSQDPLAPKILTLPPESVQILPRSYADVSIVHQPSWWTLPRLVGMVCFMGLILLAGLAWVLMLDRRVRQQTLIIQEKVWREGVLEERDRIAREFHDTLEQELAAINIQLGTVEAQFRRSPQIAFQQLELARNMTRHSLSEARRSVWDLRSHLLENSNLATALQEMGAPLSPNGGVQIVVQTFGTPVKLPALIEHNLLRIAQEALVNAIKHSAAKRIVVSLNYKTEQVQLGILDDGAGFAPETSGTVNCGHFGLLNMRERAEKIGAHFSLVTQPGNGTEIIATVASVASVTLATHLSEHTNLATSAKEKLAQT